MGRLLAIGAAIVVFLLGVAGLVTTPEELNLPHIVGAPEATRSFYIVLVIAGMLTGLGATYGTYSVEGVIERVNTRCHNFGSGAYTILFRLKGRRGVYHASPDIPNAKHLEEDMPVALRVRNSLLFLWCCGGKIVACEPAQREHVNA